MGPLKDRVNDELISGRGPFSNDVGNWSKFPLLESLKYRVNDEFISGKGPSVNDVGNWEGGGSKICQNYWRIL